MSRWESNSHWEEITKQEEIEWAPLRELSQRFNQASETPFQTEPLLSLIGNLGTTPTSEQILQGVLRPPPTLDEWAAKLIPFLKQVLPTADPIDLTPEQYAASWKRVKEKTSAGPSGLTIPHMKAHGISHLVTEVDTIMANLPYRYGFSPKRWRKGLDVMLEKKPGDDSSASCVQSCYMKQISIRTTNDWEDAVSSRRWKRGCCGAIWQ
jgi:hypothetical protein